MAQQTAVEWLMQNIEKTLPNFIEAWGVEFEQAKQMEKEQSKKDFIAGMEFIAVDPNRYDEDAEQYYNETYKQ